ncbi:MAG TPA: DUF4349 domain-containing protein [Acidimicrobiales bacterium]
MRHLRRHRTLATSTFALALLLLTASCGSTGDDATGGATGDADGGASGGGSAKDAPVLLQSAAQPAERRDVVYTGDLVVRVSSVAEATAKAAEITDANDGFVFAQTTDEDETTLTLKVPSDAFDATVDAVADLGKELRRTLQAEDVTAEVVDVENRLKSAQASVDRLRSLLAQAGSAADVVAVEGELAKREAELESLQGRARVLEDQVALATLTVRLTERNDVAVSDDLPGFLGGLRSGAVTLLNIGQVVLVVVGFLVPFVPIVALAAWAARRYRRRRRARLTAAPLAGG